jgi:hypothetical protein
MPKPRSECELWQALQGLDDDLLDPALGEAAVDDELAAAGIGPSALAASAKRLAEDAQRLAWQQRAARRRNELAAKLPAASSASMTRGEMLARLDELRVAAPGQHGAIRLAARKRKAEESTDDELRQLLDEMEALRALEGDEPG